MENSMRKCLTLVFAITVIAICCASTHAQSNDGRRIRSWNTIAHSAPRSTNVSQARVQHGITPFWKNQPKVQAAAKQPFLKTRKGFWLGAGIPDASKANGRGLFAWLR